MNRVISKTFLSGKAARLAVEALLIVKSRRAGYLVIVRVTGRSERVPYTIADADVDTDTITLIIQAVGESSQRLVALNAGDMIYDIVGPLGQATRIESSDIVVRVGGGVGMAPLYPITKVLKAVDDEVIVVVTTYTRELIILEKEFKEFADKIIIMTDDGSCSTGELVTDGVESVIKYEEVDLCVMIGPTAMVKFVVLLMKKCSIPAISSLNTIMVDDTSMCGICRITVGGKTCLVHVDGPEFNTHQVDFDELPMRLSTYRE